MHGCIEPATRPTMIDVVYMAMVVCDCGRSDMFLCTFDVYAFVVWSVRHGDGHVPLSGRAIDIADSQWC